VVTKNRGKRKKGRGNFVATCSIERKLKKNDENSRQKGGPKSDAGPWLHARKGKEKRTLGEGPRDYGRNETMVLKPLLERDKNRKGEIKNRGVAKLAH